MGNMTGDAEKEEEVDEAFARSLALFVCEILVIAPHLH